jgi:predicted RNA-binding protein with TRAM domain
VGTRQRYNLAEEEGSEMRGKRFPSSYFKEKPVKVGDVVELTISEISRRGDGLARLQGYVIFVPHTNKGDTVKAKITQVLPSHALGEVVQ